MRYSQGVLTLPPSSAVIKVEKLGATTREIKRYPVYIKQLAVRVLYKPAESSTVKVDLCSSTRLWLIDEGPLLRKP